MSFKVLRDARGFSEVISSVILTSVIMVIVITSAYYANDVIRYNLESVEFDQAINSLLSLERMVDKIMFNPGSTCSIRTSFKTTCPYFTQDGTLVIFANETEIASISENAFRIKGGESVGVSLSFDYVGNHSKLIVGLNEPLGCVRKYQNQGAWVSLDYFRIRCVYSGVMSYYNGTNPEPKRRNVVEILAVQLNSSDLNPMERSRVILENLDVQTQQIILPQGNFSITVQFNGNEESVSLTSLGGNPEIPTLINLTTVRFKITVLGG